MTVPTTLLHLPVAICTWDDMGSQDFTEHIHGRGGGGTGGWAACGFFSPKPCCLK